MVTSLGIALTGPAVASLWILNALMSMGSGSGGRSESTILGEWVAWGFGLSGIAITWVLAGLSASVGLPMVWIWFSA